MIAPDLGNHYVRIMQRSGLYTTPELTFQSFFSDLLQSRHSQKFTFLARLLNHLGVVISDVRGSEAEKQTALIALTSSASEVPVKSQ
jgi:hypothetical protein